MKRLTTLLFSALLLTTACDKTEETPEPQPTGCSSSFATDVRPIIKNKCAISGCHDGNGNIANLDSYQALEARADNGNGRLREFVLDKGIMPPQTATQLTDEEKNLIRCWLDNDAQEN